MCWGFFSVRERSIMNNLSHLLHCLGINATYRGYHYLYQAVELALTDEEYLVAITKRMYIDIASYYHIPVSNVERNLRTVITVCWERGNRNLLRQISYEPLLIKPSAGKFIDILVTYCKLQKICH